MKIRLLIATCDSDYSEHLSDVLSKDFSDAIEVSVCSTNERLHTLLEAQSFDAALLDSSMLTACDLKSILLPMLLWAKEDEAIDIPSGVKSIRKYQRISSLAGTILENYALISSENNTVDPDRAFVTAVWSPAGGVGKTTVALAYAARRVSEGKQVLYLDLESFSSVPAFFTESGTSISTVFDMLENRSGNLKVLLKGILRLDSAAGIGYFCRPNNYDDINILSSDDISTLITACSGVTEELVIDLPSVCDDRAQRIFEMADSILLITDPSPTAKAKLSQFVTQHNIFERIRSKTKFVANKGASLSAQPVDCNLSLPLLHAADAPAVYRTLAAGM